MSRGGNQSRYQKQQKRSYQSGSQSARRLAQKSSGRKESSLKAKARLEGDALDRKLGFERYEEGGPRLGWLLNLLPTSSPDEVGREESGVDLYFLAEDGRTFKTTFYHAPYFYLAVQHEKHLADVSLVLNRRFEEMGMTVSIVEKEDLDLPNHLSGKLHRLLKLSFLNVGDLAAVRKELQPIVQANRKRRETRDAYRVAEEDAPEDFLETVVDLREHDVPYPVRVAIDCDVRVGGWYTVTPRERGCGLEWLRDRVVKAEPKVLAFDIECTKAPLKFPNAEIDQVFMISYMVDGRGYLIISREVVSEDIEDFEYTPKPAYKGPFTVFNERNEELLLRRFFTHCQEEKPHIYVTYNGDFFDWPFLEARAKVYGIEMQKELGVGSTAEKPGQRGEYRGRCAVHLDAFAWVQRDSYLPCGARGLKAVTKYKLGYDPVEVDPEDMVPLARSNPSEMAAYSVSDAVATYYLYQTYVHLFIYSLATVIPMGPEDVLRKGSGTLCESLLMVQAYKVNVLCPNKQKDPLVQFHEGHLVESETYVGGHVEALESGVFRADIPTKFQLEPSALQGLIDNIDRDLCFACEVEDGTQRSEVANYDEVRAAIVEKLEALRDRPKREEAPFVYHLDVAAMYPNIILTNRLQPNAVVDAGVCAACDFNQADNDCKRDLEWVWRGDFSPAGASEYAAVRHQLQHETVNGEPFSSLSEAKQAQAVKERLKLYANKVYKKTKLTEERVRTDTTCMRENPMYVDTVRAFRDRRYDYKLLTKAAKKEVAKAEAAGDAAAAKVAGDKELLYDSLQLAHKCILNSFYGYVMRKGARWRNMPMAGIVTYTGANLITQARQLVEQIGRPLELDTDGIWCILPSSFPENYFLKTRDGRKIFVSYPGLMLNADVHKNYTNHQYQDLEDPALRTYSKKSECSIFFEVDGPYRCMVIPSSTEEGKLLKKRYAVFNFDGSLAELKGFELKRRGELELIKAFQSEIFELFLKGSNLKECYGAVAAAADQWLDVLDSRAADLSDEELLDLISEDRTISKTLDDYEGQKGTALTSAKRLADFLGDEMVKDAGLNCKLIISIMPFGAPVAERAVPVAIFSAEPAVRRAYLRKWLKRPQLEDFDIRRLLDWDYYRNRLATNVLKIVTIPAALQKVPNPCPRVQPPEWLLRKIREKEDSRKQLRLDQFWGPAAARPAAKTAAAGTAAAAAVDIEDTVSGGAGPGVGRPVVHRRPRPGAAAAAGAAGAAGAAAAGAAVGAEGGEAPSQQGSKKDAEAALTAEQKRKAEEEQKKKEQEIIVPDRDEDFQGWMAASKQKWRLWRKQRKERTKKLQRRGEAGGMAAVGPGGGSGKNPKLGSGGLRGFLREGAATVLQSYWQVVEVAETATPGEFAVWAATGPADLQKLRLTVPRVFYLNSKEPAPEDAPFDLRATSRALPHGQPARHLYECRVPERRVRRNAAQLRALLGHPDTLGAYELRTPLLFRALLHLGCVAKVTEARQAMGLEKGAAFELEDLEEIGSTAAHPYLSPGSARFRRLFLYHARAGERALTGLFVLAGDNADLEEEGGERPVVATAQVWVANPYTSTEARPPLRRIFDEECQVEGSECKFSLHYTQSDTESLNAANLAITRYQQSRPGPTLVQAQVLGLPGGGGGGGSSSPAAAAAAAPSPLALRRALPALHDFPLLVQGANAADGAFPALGWQAWAARRAVARFLRAGAWLAHRLGAARHAHLPAANLGADPPLAAADAAFARALRRGRHLLWASAGPRPDLGGLEADEDPAWAEERERVRVSAPGCHRTVCVELQLFGLAVGSIAAADQIEALEGVGASAAAGAAGADAAVAPAFQILKRLVTTWLRDVAATGNPHADALLLHAYRWLCGRGAHGGGGGALLADPALHRAVHALMTKVFLRLIAELKRLGAQVVFANFQKIIIATGKTDVGAAAEYVAFVTRTVLAREVFQVLQLHPEVYWEQLVFMDEENYGGVQVDLERGAEEDGGGAEEGGEEDEEEQAGGEEARGAPRRPGPPAAADVSDDEDEEVDTAEAYRRDELAEEEEEEEEEEETERQPPAPAGLAAAAAAAMAGQEGREEGEGEEEEEAEVGGLEAGPGGYRPHIVSHWNLSEFLPPACQEYFLLAAGELAYRPREEARRLRAQLRQGRLALSQAATQGQAAPPTAAAAAGTTAAVTSEADVAREVERYMKGFVAGRFTKKMLEMTSEIMRYNTGPECFPVLPGSHLKLSNPALEFAKSVCRVFALDPALAQEVQLLRRQLLAHIGAAREFDAAAVWRDPCASFVLPDVTCGFCNLCRDLDLCRDPAVLGEKEDRWRCLGCGHSLDKRGVEARLVAHVEALQARYQLQDLRCAQCRAVADRRLAPTCPCAGAFAGDLRPGDLRAEMATLRRVARYHGFEWAREAVDAVLPPPSAAATAAT